jgi:hypothetical protein
LPSILSPIVHEFVAPHMVLPLRHEAVATVRRSAQTASFPAPLGHSEPFSAPEALHPTKAHAPPVPAKQSTNASVAEADVLGRVTPHGSHECRLNVGALISAVPLCGAWLTNQHPGTTFGDVTGCLEMSGRSTSADRAQKFPSARCFSIRLSSACSATRRVSYAFSFSSSFRRFISSPFMPPYWWRQRW